MFTPKIVWLFLKVNNFSFFPDLVPFIFSIVTFYVLPTFVDGVFNFLFQFNMFIYFTWFLAISSSTVLILFEIIELSSRWLLTDFCRFSCVSVIVFSAFLISLLSEKSTKLRALRAHVPTSLACLRAHVPTCLACLRAHIPTCFACSRT